VVLSPLVRHRAEQLGVAVAAVHGSGPGGLVTRDDVELVGARRGTGTRLRASPLARRRAMAEGVDLAALEGSGPDGAIVAADVVRTAVRPKRDVDAQAAVGALMARSKREIPHYYLTVHVDLSATLAWLEDRNRTAGVDDRILPAALLLRATSLAAMEVPEVNGWWRDGGFDAAPHVDLGVAVARRGGGLVAPVIVGADRLALPALMHAFSDLVARAKSGRLRASEMGDPSITVTSLGDAGADAVVPVIYPPQVAMVGIGRIAERPWAEGGMVGARRTVFLSLAGDHRVTSGHQGSRFLRTLERLLHEPEVL
jgi:pyruvate dehydrogenase E2 component (dihydrolipoamide acetyltransferase)